MPRRRATADVDDDEDDSPSRERGLRELLASAGVSSIGDADVRRISSDSASDDDDSALGGATRGRKGRGSGRGPGRRHVDDDGGESLLSSAGSTSTSALSLPSFIFDDTSVSDSGRGTRRRQPLRTPGTDMSGMPMPASRSPSRQRANREREVASLTQRLRDLQEELDEADHSKRKMELDMVLMKDQFHQALDQHKAQLDAELESAQSDAAAAVKEVASLREQLSDAKAGYRDLSCSEATYEELRAMPEHRLSLRQFVLVRARELVAPKEQAIEALRQKLAASQAAMSDAVEVLDREKRELLHRARLAEGHEEALKRELAAYQDNELALQKALTGARAQVDELVGKGARFDEVCKRADELQEKFSEARHRADALEASLSSTRAEKEELSKGHMELLQRVEILQVDKLYLQKSVADSTERMEQLRGELEHARSKCRTLKDGKDTFADQLVKAREDARTAVEERLMTEMTRLQEQSKRELDEIRTSSREVFERENQALRDSRAEVVAECNRLRARLDSLQQAHDALSISQRTSAADAEGVMSELRTQLKMKAFEHERLCATHEEVNSALRQARIENDMLRDKQEVLKKEFTDLETRALRSTARAEAQLEAEREKVRSYERLEVELDTAVLSAAGASSDDGAADIARLGASVPTQPRRRVEQSIHLAQRLLKAQAEVEELRKRYGAATEELTVARREAEATRNEAYMAQQPQQFLIKSMREREQEVARLQRENEELRDQLRGAQSIIKTEAGLRQELQSDLERVLTERRRLGALREQVQQAMTAPAPAPAPASRPAAAPAAASTSPAGAGGGSGDGTLSSNAARVMERLRSALPPPQAAAADRRRGSTSGSVSGSGAGTGGGVASDGSSEPRFRPRPRGGYASHSVRGDGTGAGVGAGAGGGGGARSLGGDGQPQIRFHKGGPAPSPAFEQRQRPVRAMPGADAGSYSHPFTYSHTSGGEAAAAADGAVWYGRRGAATGPGVGGGSVMSVESVDEPTVGAFVMHDATTDGALPKWYSHTSSRR